jgi:hypothetical protein
MTLRIEEPQRGQVWVAQGVVWIWSDRPSPYRFRLYVGEKVIIEETLVIGPTKRLPYQDRVVRARDSSGRPITIFLSIFTKGFLTLAEDQ